MKEVLIVDDDPRNIFALKATLQSKGIQCRTAGDAETALRLLEENKGIGVVLMDMMMPEIDGYQAIAAIRGKHELAQTIVIAVTAQAMVGDREKCLEAGADDYISKPVDVDLLMKKLQHFLNR